MNSKIKSTLLCFSGILLLQLSCCKKPIPKKTATDIGYYGLDSTFKSFFTFDVGSEWIYENKGEGINGIKGRMDTVKCAYFQRNVYDVNGSNWIYAVEGYQFRHQSVNPSEKGIYEIRQYGLRGSTSRGSNIKKPTFNSYLMNRQVSASHITSFKYSTTGEYGPKRVIQDTILNGIPLKNVWIFEYQGYQYPDRLSYTSELWWAQNIGIVSDYSLKGISPFYDKRWDWQISSYTVKPI